jgi:hypothetical protein
MIKKLFTLLILAVVQFTFSQDIKFGKVSKEELLEKVYPTDSTANAAILYKSQKTYFNATTIDIKLVTEIQQRIKIYNKEGFDKATIALNLFKSRGTREKVSKIKAYTFNLENDKIVKTDLDKDQIFKSDFSYNYDQVKFTMPNVQEGSVIDIEYKIISPFYFNIDEFKFQYDIPVKKLEAELRTPRGYNFSTKQKGYITFYPQRSMKTDQRLGMTVDILNYNLQDIPALKEESFVNNMNNYTAGVVFELVSIEIPGSVNRRYSKSWGDVARTIGSTDDYKEELDKTNSFDETLDALINGNSTYAATMESIFKYIKDNIKWNGVDGKYFQKGIRGALKEGKGNAADINLTLVAMLRYAGIDANPLIISTKDNLVPFFPTVDRLNYVIAYAVIDDQRYFLDATEEFSDINLLPLKDYNWQGILVDNNKLEWRKVSLNEPKPGASQYSINANVDEEGVIDGKLRLRHTNHSAYRFRENFKDQDLDAFIAKREESFENVEISNYDVKNTDTYDGYVSESFEFYKESGADIIDDKIYIQPLLFLKTTENPFKLETRAFPIDFGYPIKNSYIVSIKIPEGYTASSVPEAMVMKIPNELGEFRYAPKVIGNTIQLSVLMEINKTTVDAAMYPYLKEFFGQMISKQKEQIVLAKSQP